MSRKILIGLVFCLFFACTNTYAAYVGSISDPVKEGEWRITTFKDKTNAKRFLVRTGTLQGAILLTDAKITKISSNGIQINYGYSDALSMFFKFGQADRMLETKWTDSVIRKLRYNDGNMYGLGLKYVEEVDDDGLIFGGDLQVNVYAGENVDHVTAGGVPATLILSPGEGELREFQGSLLVGQKINMFKKLDIFPYLGCAINKSKLKVDETTYWGPGIGATIYKIELTEDRSFGYIAGIDFNLSDTFNLNIETRHYIEAAYTIGFSFDF